MATQTAVLKIDLQIEGGQKLALSVGNLKELKAAIKQINDTRITLDPRSPEFQTASNQLKTLQGLYKGLAKDADSAGTQIDQATQSLNQQPKAIGYYRQLQAQLVTLKNQFKDLSETEARGKLGQGLSSNINALSGKLKGLDANLGDFQRNVGNYRSGLLSVGDVLTGGLATGGVVAGVGAIVGVMKLGVGQAVAYEKALSNLSALTGLEGAGLAKLDGVARELQNITVNGQEIVNTGPEILNALKLVGGARPELLKDADALGDVAKNAIILAGASGDELKPSVDALTTTLGQFKLASTESARVINELAAGAKEGSAEIPQITAALKEFGTVAEISNISTSESIALIETLAARQLKGSEAGTQLRNVLSKLASADILPKNAQRQFQRLGIDINILKDTTLPFEVRLKELGKAQGDLSALTKIFGLENLQAATIITSGIPQYVKLNEAVQGTSEAYKQAGINADNVATKFNNLKKNSLNNLEQEFTSTTSAGFGLGKSLDFLLNRLDLIGFAVNPLKKIFDNSFAFFGGNKAKTANDFPAPEKRDLNASDPFFGVFTPAAEVNDETDALLKQVDALKENTEETDKNAASKSKAKVENLGAADSIARLTKNVQLYRDELEKAPQNKLFDATVKLVKAEQLLATAEARRRIARENATSTPGKPLSELDQANAGLLTIPVVVDTPANEAEAKRQLDALALSLSGSVGVVMPVDIDQDQARRDFEIQKYFLDQENKIRDKDAEKQQGRKEKRAAQDQELFSAALQAADQFNQLLAASDNARVERQLSASLSAIDDEFATKREAAQGNAVILADLDKQQKAKEVEAEKAAAKQRKAIAIKEATIAFFLALIRAAPNPAALALAAATYAISLVGIQAQEFHAGGKVKDLKNESGVVTGANMRPTVRGDNKVALLKVGERVLTEQNQRDAEMQYGTGVWKSIRAKDPNSILGHRHGSMAPPIYAAGGNVLKVTTNLSREDIGVLSRAISQTNDRMAGVVESAMVKGAKYAAREAKVFSKTG